MKDLIYWLMEKLVGKDVLHYKINIQLGVELVLLAVAFLLAWYGRIIYTQWDHIKRSADSIPLMVSNTVNNVVEDDFGRKINTIEQGVIQAQVNEGIISQQIFQVQTDIARLNRKSDRIDDYIFDKLGVRLDFESQATNRYTFIP